MHAGLRQSLENILFYQYYLPGEICSGLFISNKKKTSLKVDMEGIAYSDLHFILKIIDPIFSTSLVSNYFIFSKNFF
jgi:hypothetical protein